MDSERFLYLAGYAAGQNMTKAAALALAAKLGALNFPVGRTYVITTPRIPLGQPAASQEIDLADLPADVPEDFAMQFYFDFAAGGLSLTGHNAGLMSSTLGDGSLAGFRQVHGMLNPGDVYGWVNHLLGVPGVTQAVQKVLAGK